MSTIIKKLQSPVVLGVIIAGAGVLLKSIQDMVSPTWIDIALAVLVYIAAVFGAMNNPDTRERF